MSLKQFVKKLDSTLVKHRDYEEKVSNLYGNAECMLHELGDEAWSELVKIIKRVYKGKDDDIMVGLTPKSDMSPDFYEYQDEILSFEFSANIYFQSTGASIFEGYLFLEEIMSGELEMSLKEDAPKKLAISNKLAGSVSVPLQKKANQLLKLREKQRKVSAEIAALEKEIKPELLYK